MRRTTPTPGMGQEPFSDRRGSNGNTKLKGINSLKTLQEIADKWVCMGCYKTPGRALQTNKVQSVQCISDQCVKGKWPKQTFGSVSGGALILGNTLDKSIPWYVCEGWASAVSMVFHHLHGNGVCASSFGKSNQRKVAELMAEFHQPKEIIILEEVAQ